MCKAVLCTATPSPGVQPCLLHCKHSRTPCCAGTGCKGRTSSFCSNNKATPNIYKIFRLASHKPFSDVLFMIMQAYAAKGVHRMYPWQAAALECGKTGNNLVYCAPTSGGKSLVAEILLIRRLSNTKRPGRPHGGFHVSTSSALPRL